MKKLLLLAVSVLTLQSCDTWFSNDKHVDLSFDTEYKGERVVPGTTYFRGDTAFKFDLIHFYISDVYFNDVFVQDVIFVAQSEDDVYGTTVQIPDWTKDVVETITFGVGLDSVQNAQSPASFDANHPLSSLNAMYWSWATKYRFIKIDGRVNASGIFGDDDLLLAWHTGMDELYRTVTLNVPGGAQRGDRIRVVFDLEKFMQGVSLGTESVTHTAPDDYHIAVKLTNNLESAFYAEVITE